MLTWCIFLPLITAAILILIPSGWKGLIKSVSVIGALLTFIVSVNLAIGYRDDAGDIIEGTDATTVLKDAQETILGGADWKTGVDPKGAEFRKAAYPSADSKSFNPEQYAAAKKAVRAFASSEAAADEAEAVLGDAMPSHIDFAPPPEPPKVQRSRAGSEASLGSRA